MLPLKAEKVYADSIGEDGSIKSVPVLDITCTKNYYCSYGIEKIIDINGERVRVFYLYFSETIYTKMTKNDGKLYRFAESAEDYQFDRMEVYYIPNKICTDDRSDYYALRNQYINEIMHMHLFM